MKPAGSEVKLTYQTAAEVAAGDAVVTGTGRAYLVIAARRMRSSRPGDPCWALVCIVADAAPPGVVLHPLFWWPRGRRRR